MPEFNSIHTQKSPSTYEILSRPENLQALTEHQGLYEAGATVLRMVCKIFDTKYGGEFPPLVFDKWDNRGCERGRGRLVGYDIERCEVGYAEPPDGTGYGRIYRHAVSGAILRAGSTADFIDEVCELVAAAIGFERWKQKEAAKIPAPVTTAKQYKRPSREAMRKRKARAEGRVKARPPRPARTLVQEVESRKKAVTTRQAQLRNMKGIETMTDSIKMQISLERAKKALATAQRRASESQAV